MTRKPQDITILIDVDDVINNLCEAWCNWLDEKYKTGVKYTDIKEWDMQVAFPLLTAEEIYEPLFDEDFWHTVNPNIDAIKYVYQLMQDGYNIYLCTTTNYKNVKIKFEFIQKYFTYITWNHVIVCSRKQIINADILIDDAPHNLVGGKYQKILMTQPHNENFDNEAYGIHRVNNWEECYDTIHSIIFSD